MNCSDAESQRMNSGFLAEVFFPSENVDSDSASDILPSMKVLVVGSGGREHALIWKLASDSCRPTLFCAPGNAGTAELATNISIESDNIKALVAWAMEPRISCSYKREPKPMQALNASTMALVSFSKRPPQSFMRTSLCM